MSYPSDDPMDAPTTTTGFLSVFHPWEALPEPTVALWLAMGMAGWWCSPSGPIYPGDIPSARASLVAVAHMIHMGRRTAAEGS